MKHFLTTLLFCLIFSSMQAQTQDTTISMKNRTEEYCIVLATQKAFSYKVTITIDYGLHRSMWKDSRVTDEAGQLKVFESVVDALNYMNSLGWEFMNAYVITVSSQNVYHYLMKRKIQT